MTATPATSMNPLRHRASESHGSATHPAADTDTPQPETNAATTIPFGREMRRLFNFAPGYTPLNHGSFGTIPRAVLEHRFQILRDWEARECVYNLLTYPAKLAASRAAVAPFLGADPGEVVLATNATSATNTVLRNLKFEADDVIVYPETVYGACRKTVQSLEEMTPVRGVEIPVVYPVEDDELVEMFRDAVKGLREQGKNVRVAIFDTIASRPGVRVPWERIVGVCREMGVLSLIDGAHGIGHIDLTHVGEVKPDFFVTNCHKWLFTPRGSAVLYVPFANQYLLTTNLPTSHGYLDPVTRQSKASSQYFADLFTFNATTDVTPHLAIPEAIRFRRDLCGGEPAIREYCAKLAREGGDRAALLLGTEVMDNKSGSLRAGCAFANIRLPLKIIDDEDEDEEGVPRAEVDRMIGWFYDTTARDFDTYLQTFYYAGAVWTRLSAQVYLDVKDFEWAAGTIKELCVRVRRGEWRTWGS
ncbi:pyridoxal phosphate-dependent transferase [Echria macrotheca]|uniref:Pyridoxal phosphate-dependent transferase n=1 Tax=Echria macrotheca TaxID=438768 RepID=A0AAJ0F2P0_9PEZI|nr:pyridoxal phosphate-dependent transferase [Echria macrotheca]